VRQFLQGVVIFFAMLVLLPTLLMVDLAMQGINIVTKTKRERRNALHRET